MGCIFREEEILPPVFEEYIIGMPGSAGAGYDSLLIFITTRRSISESSVAWPRETEPNTIDLHDLVIVFRNAIVHGLDLSGTQTLVQYTFPPTPSVPQAGTPEPGRRPDRT